METRSAVRAPQSFLLPAILVFFSLGMAGCGPQSFRGGFLASWSPDGSRVALVPDCLTSEDGESSPLKSGVWVYSNSTGRTKPVYSAGEGLICLHPQWSPFSDDLLFITVAEDPKEEEKGGKPDNYAIWCVGPDGEGLRHLATGSYRSDGEGSPALLLPNTAAWGDLPFTLLVQQRVGNKVTAFLLDPGTGGSRQFLPDLSDSYSLEPSPDRRKIAALLYDTESGLARLYLSDFGFGNWHLLDIMPFDSGQLDSLSPMIYWAPDSTGFVVPQAEQGMPTEKDRQGFLRLFDARTGGSRRIAGGNPQSVIQWDREGRSFVFSAAGGAKEADLTIYRVDVVSARQVALIPEGENHLMTWNSRDGRIYFYRTHHRKNSQVNEMFSCAADGSDERTEGFLFGGENPSWSSSADGESLIVFSAPRAPVLMNLTHARIAQLFF